MFVLRLLYFVSLAFAIGGHAWAQEGERPSPEGLAVFGSARYDTPPTIVRISGHVSTSGDTLAEARDSHPAAVTAVRRVLDEQAASGLKIVRSTYRISENRPYQYDDSPSVTPEMKEKVVYEATTSFELQTSNFAEIDQIVAAIAGTDLLVTTTSFEVEDDRVPLLEARKSAALDALAQAQAYAEALNLRLVGVKSVTDGEARPPDGYADLGIVTSDPTVGIVVPETIPFFASVYVTWTVELNGDERP